MLPYPILAALISLGLSVSTFVFGKKDTAWTLTAVILMLLGPVPFVCISQFYVLPLIAAIGLTVLLFGAVLITVLMIISWGREWTHNKFVIYNYYAMRQMGMM